MAARLPAWLGSTDALPTIFSVPLMSAELLRETLARSARTCTASSTAAARKLDVSDEDLFVSKALQLEPPATADGRDVHPVVAVAVGKRDGGAAVLSVFVVLLTLFGMDVS